MQRRTELALGPYIRVLVVPFMYIYEQEEWQQPGAGRVSTRGQSILCLGRRVHTIEARSPHGNFLMYWRILTLYLQERPSSDFIYKNDLLPHDNRPTPSDTSPPPVRPPCGRATVASPAAQPQWRTGRQGVIFINFV